MNKKIITKVILFAALVSVLAFLMAKKIDLTSVDLGRHIKNGELLIENVFDKKLQHEVLNTNLYSYTHPEHFFVNRHWGTGVLFYSIWKLAGFEGLSIFNILTIVVSFGIVCFIAKKHSNFYVVLALSVLAIPLIAQRYEIRPEFFTYLVSPIIFWVLVAYSKGKLSFGWLFVVPVLIGLWVNVNLYFVFGVYLVGLFWLEQLWFHYFKKVIPKNEKPFQERKDEDRRIKQLTIILVLSMLVTLFNPWGALGAVYPFIINAQIDFSIIELVSPFVLKQQGMLPAGFANYFILLGLFVVSFAVYFSKEARAKASPAILLWAVTVALLSVYQLRNVALFGLFAIISISYNFSFLKLIFNIQAQKGVLAQTYLRKKLIINSLFAAVLVVIVFGANADYLRQHAAEAGMGATDIGRKPIELILKNKSEGRVFHNLAISSFLIHELYPDKKVFFDHRPEAYPMDFFEEEYLPNFVDEDAWKKTRDKYGIEFILLRKYENLPRIQKYIDLRTQDSEWSKVFEDDHVVLFFAKETEDREYIEQ